MSPKSPPIKKKGRSIKTSIGKISFKPGGENGLRSKRVIDAFCKRQDLAPIRYEIPFSQAGESLVYVKDQLGHSSISMTVDTYGHLVPGANRAAKDRLPTVEESVEEAPQKLTK